MITFRCLRLSHQAALTLAIYLSLLCLVCMESDNAIAQDLSWVNGAIERTKSVQRENLPAWQFDPRVAASNGDASLNGLIAVNPDRLFAVGDRGLILNSVDGGRNWHPQANHTSLNLYGVAFFDEQRGVAVGGNVQPLSQSSVGIVLVTSNGGKSWETITVSMKAALPRLTGVTIDNQTLRAWGDYSSAHGSGVFESQDQGRTWQPVAAPLGHVQSVAREKHGLILGLDRAGRLAQIPHNLNRSFLQLAPPTSPIHSLIHTGTQWLAVGDQATITSSRDGTNWVDHALPLSAPARSVCSFRCVTVIEQNIWVAGTPGSILLHSADAGQSWRAVPLDQSWPVSAIQFVDRHRGWLVTSAGSIWATRDGGTSWFAQRVPVKRLGLQAIAASASTLSWPALANAAWQARQATDLITVYRENIEDTVDTSPDAPATLSTLGGQLGLVGAWLPSQWSISSSHLQLPASSANDPMQDQITHWLAMRLRAGRPSVVLIDDVAGSASNNERFADMVTQAAWFSEANQPGLEWIERELHLPPWKPTKLLSASGAERADFTISSEELLRDSGLAMQDVLAPIFGKQSLGFPNVSLRCLQLSSGNSASRQNLFASQDRLPDTTRGIELSKIGNMQLVMGRSHREKAWQALAPTPLNAEEDINLWSKKLETVIQQTPKHECGEALLQLAQRCLADRQWKRWLVTLERVTQHTPLSDHARYGSLQIMRMVASEEFLAWQSQSPSAEQEERDIAVGPLAVASSPRGIRIGDPQETDPFDSPASVNKTIARAGNGTSALSQSAVQMVSAEVPMSPVDVARIIALRQAVSEFNRLSESDRALVARPEMLMAHYARRRALSELAGDPAPDTGSLQALTTKSWLAGWPQVAAQEFITAGGRADRPAWSARAARTTEAPVLDGQANEACWRSATPIELANPFAPPGSTASTSPSATRSMFAYDDEFLYGFISCPLVVNSDAPPASAKVVRRYDMNLAGSDYFVLQLDTDRDYSSTSEIAINHLGHTFDRCCGYSQWNPRWHVDVQKDQSMWSAEFAIRLSDLTTRSPSAGTAWAISAFRHIPNWGLQSWSQLRSASPHPQGNGLLVFE